MTRCLPVAAGHMLRMLMLAIWTFAIGCAGGTDVGNPEMSSFASDTALEDYLISQHAKIAMPMARQSVADDIPPGVISPDMDKTTSGDMNTAMSGKDADAPDRVVSGNGCLYVAGKSDVRIISALRPEDMRLAGRIAVNGRVEGLHLYGQRLVVLYTPEGDETTPQGADDDGRMETGINRFDAGLPDDLPAENRTGILVADVRVPELPVINKHFQANGFRMASRISGGFLYVALRFMPDLPPLQRWHDGTKSGAAEAENYNARALDGLTVDHLTPSYTAFDDFGEPVARGRLIATENYIRPAEPGGGAILSIISMDLDVPGSDFSSMGVIADIHHVYVSPNTFYLLATAFDDDMPDISRTRIHLIDIAGDAAQYAAHGSVSGRLLAPSAVGQYQDVLYISTITGLFSDNTADGHIFCLKKKNEALYIIGRLEHLFSGRTPGFARFIGPRGFVANAEDSQRITIIDLADPPFPQTAGEMTIQGPLAGLFRVDDDRLLAVTENVCTVENRPNPGLGLCLSLFDITDAGSPQLRHAATIRGDDLDASLIFRLPAPPLFRPEDRLLAVPVAIDYSQPSSVPPETAGPERFAGLYFYQLSDEEELEPMERLALWPDMTLDKPTDDDDFPAWIRGVLHDEAVYVIGPDRVRAGSVNRMAEGWIIHPRFTLLLE